MRPARLALLDERDRHLAERLGQIGLLGEAHHEAVGAGQPRRATADDDDADLDALVLRVGRRGDELRRRADGRRVVAGDDAVAARHYEPFLALMASVSLGTILLRSPTIPRSENSKIGALASLLIATMFSEDCIPTLCWIAPEMPAAR